MEAALRGVLQNTLGEYVDGLQQTGVSFPLTLRDLRLKEKKVNEEFCDGDTPFDLTDGRIASVTVTPGWMGDLEVVVSNVVLRMAFNPMKVMKRMTAPQEQDDGPEEYYYETVPAPQPAPPKPPPPPRFCHNHDSSEKRQKREPHERECKGCGIMLQTSYSEFTLCPVCSDRHQACLICGCAAPNAGTYVPAKTIHETGPPLPPQPQYGGRPESPPPRNRNRDFSMDAPHAQKGAMDTLPPPPPQDWRGKGNDRGGNRVGADVPPPPTPPQRRQNPREAGNLGPPTQTMWQQPDVWGGQQQPYPQPDSPRGNYGTEPAWDANRGAFPYDVPRGSTSYDSPPQQQQQQYGGGGAPNNQFTPSPQAPSTVPGGFGGYGGYGNYDGPPRYGGGGAAPPKQAGNDGLNAFLGLFDMSKWGLGTSACNAGVGARASGQNGGGMRQNQGYAY